ncbi:MAG: peptidoglycan-binding protein [Proteobacteria bacterium]|nr:peptidoglycan-binding protein [Burkholderiales bacterium]
MTLTELASSERTISLALIGADKALARDVQQRLSVLGLLDPPVDGDFGPASLWAVSQFLRKAGMPGKTQIDREAARLLLGRQAEALFPLAIPDTFAGRIVRAMQKEGHWLSRHPDCVNVVYLEGIDADGTPNADAPNVFNDLRVVLRVNRAGNPDIIDAWEATSEPGRFFTLVQKLDPNGAARIAFGQYKAWSVGTHMSGRPSAHEALVQTKSITVHRDFNQDFDRVGDKTFDGMFGVNQHWGFDLPKSDIGRASAGCLVGRTRVGHRAFMAIVKTDPRFVANNSYRFITTVMPAAAVQ